MARATLYSVQDGPRFGPKKVKKVLNKKIKHESYITASDQRPDGFLVFPAGHTPEVKGWLVWLLGGGHCNGVRPFFVLSLLLRSEKSISPRKMSVQSRFLQCASMMFNMNELGIFQQIWQILWQDACGRPAVESALFPFSVIRKAP
jgi:hypothetical protein